MLIFTLTLMALVLMALSRLTLASEAVMIGTRESLANSPKQITATRKGWFIGGGIIAAVVSLGVGNQLGFEGAPVMVGIFALVLLGTIYFIVTDLVGYMFSGVIKRHQQARYEPYYGSNHSALLSSNQAVERSNKRLTPAVSGAVAATSGAAWDRESDPAERSYGFPASSNRGDDKSYRTSIILFFVLLFVAGFFCNAVGTMYPSLDWIRAIGSLLQFCSLMGGLAGLSISIGQKTSQHSSTGAAAATSGAARDRDSDEDGDEKSFIGRFKLHDDEIYAPSHRSMGFKMNPANGLPMVGPLDVKGNPYGFSGSLSEHNFASASEFNHSIDFGDAHDFSSGHDFGTTESHYESFVLGGNSDH